MVAVALLLLIALWLPAAHAHGLAAAREPEAAWALAPLCLALASYAIGVARLRRRARPGRGATQWQMLSFVAGWLVLAAALLSPLDALGARRFWAHMLQHELLMVVAAPLCVLGRPLVVWLWALPPAWRRTIGTATRHLAWRTAWRALSAPPAATVLHATALSLWHVPAWFDAALRDATVHTLQHLSFLGSALLFWWAVLGAASRPAQARALAALFATMMISGALGALLTLSGTPWYPAYAASAGLDALEDQQLGGLLMWLPGGFVYLAAALARVRRWVGTQAGDAVHGRSAAA